MNDDLTSRRDEREGFRAGYEGRSIFSLTEQTEGHSIEWWRGRMARVYVETLIDDPDWTTPDGTPAYTEFIGEQLMWHLEGAA